MTATPAQLALPNRPGLYEDKDGDVWRLYPDGVWWAAWAEEGSRSSQQPHRYAPLVRLSREDSKSSGAHDAMIAAGAIETVADELAGWGSTNSVALMLRERAAAIRAAAPTGPAAHALDEQP